MEILYFYEKIVEAATVFMPERYMQAVKKTQKSNNLIAM